MKPLRILLLALLTVMLPVRGAMAAAMLCPPAHGAGAGAGDIAMTGAPAQAGHAGHGEHDHAGGDAGPQAAGHAHDGTSGTETCNLCSACCSMPSLTGSAPAVALLRHAGTAAYPRLRVPPPDFLSGGPERPPRRI